MSAPRGKARNRVNNRQRFRLKQDGIPVAWAEGPDAYGEILHYAMVYGQDGPVLIDQHRSGRWRRFPTAP